MNADPEVAPIQPQPVPVPKLGLAIASLVLGILAVVFAVKARRHMRTEPGNWLGRRRALAALIMGWIDIVGIPVILVVISVIRAALSSKPG